MKLMKPLALAGMLPVLVSCQTQPLPEPLDVVALQNEAAETTKTELCRGQEPLEAIDPETGTTITLEQLMNAPAWVQGYINANNIQWEKQCT